MKTLHYNFDCVARVPDWMYNKLWASENPWEDDPDIIEEIEYYLDEELCEINRVIYY